MQILDVVVYSHDKNKEPQKISFKPYKTNLIVGPDNSGKSSIGKIIEFCLGADYNMPTGHMDQKISWYGIRIQLRNHEYFIARKHPHIPSNISMYFKIGNPVQIPKKIDQPTTSQGTVIERLSDQLGILSGIEIPWPSYENPTEASVTNTLPFCFQYQAEIQSDMFLFHNYVEFTRTITKHILPYFLGAIPNKMVKQRYQMIKLDREIRALQKQLDELLIMESGGNRLTTNLILQSKLLGMINENEIEDLKGDTASILQVIANWIPLKTRSDLTHDLVLLQDRAIDLRDQINQLDKQIDVVKQFRNDYVDHKSKLSHQESHLKPLELFTKLNGESKKCPLCSNYLTSNNDIANAIKNSVSELTKQLENITEQTISASSILKKLEQERKSLAQMIMDNYVEIDFLINQEKKIDKVLMMI